MKPVASTITNTGTLSGESKAMTIDVQNMAHLMSVLTNLYSNPSLAVLREYSTNAIDAHIEAGVKRPIKVSLPTSLNPTLIVEDFGVGMSTDELLHLYSSYGSSTKRGTNAQTGMLGLGSKSALAITDQFTVRSRKGGVETTALIFVNDHGAGEIKIVDARATNETGTLVRMSVDSIKYARAFEKAAADLFRFWPKGSVESAANVVSIFEDKKVTWITPTIGISPIETKGYYRQAGKVTVVQGNVPYPVDESQLSEIGQKAYKQLYLAKHDIVFIADIGTLQFTPSREALYYTNITNGTLANLFHGFSKLIEDGAKADVAAASSRIEALERTEKWAEYNFRTDFTWNGQKVPTSVPCECTEGENRKHTTATRRSKLPPLSALREYGYIVINCTTNDPYALRSAIGKETGDGMRDLYSWGSNSGDTTTALFIHGDVPENWDWFGLTTVDWKDFGKVNRKGKTATVSQAGIDYSKREWKQVFGGWDARCVIENEGEGYLYVSGTQRQNAYERLSSQTAYTVVVVNKNMTDNFVKAFPKAVSWDQAKAVAAAEIAKVTTDNYRKSQMISRRGIMDKILAAKPSEILDPDLRAVVELSIAAKSDGQKVNDVRTRYKNLAPFDVEPVKWDQYTKVMERYDSYIGRYNINLNTAEATDLVNALYTYKHRKGN